MPDTKLDIRVYPIDEPTGTTKAFASVSVNDIVAMRGIRVIEDDKGAFISMPQSKDNKTGKFHDIAFPLSGDLRKEISKATLEEYHRVSDLPSDQRGYENIEPENPPDIAVEDIHLDIRVYPLEEPSGNTKAFASVSIDNLIAIRGMRVIEGSEGHFVAMPQSQDKYATYHDVAFPLVGDLRKEISRQVLEKFDTEKNLGQKASLETKLAEGTGKAAGHVAPQKSAAKAHPGVLE